MGTITWRDEFTAIGPEWVLQGDGDPNRGVISIVSDKLRLTGGTYPTWAWTPTRHLGAAVPLSVLGPDLAGMISIKVKTTLVAAGAWNGHGIAWFESESPKNFRCLEVGRQGSFGPPWYARPTGYVNSARYDGTYDPLALFATGVAALMWTFWNNGVADAEALNGDVLTPDQLKHYVSRDNGVTWTSTGWPAETMLPIVPTHALLDVSVFQPGTAATEDFDWVELAVTTPTVPISTAVGISDVVPIAKDLVKVEFSGDIAVTDQVMDPDNYQLTGGIAATRVLPIEDDSTTEVYLLVSPRAEAGTTYSLTIPSGGTVTPLLREDFPPETFYTPAEVPLQTMTGSWVHHRTKVDAALANLPPLYSKAVGGTARAIVQAIGMSDEEIGGDF